MDAQFKKTSRIIHGGTVSISHFEHQARRYEVYGDGLKNRVHVVAVGTVLALSASTSKK